VCTILPEILRKPVEAKNECKQVAQEMRDAYFDGKPFNSSKLNFAYVSIKLHVSIFLEEENHDIIWQSLRYRRNTLGCISAISKGESKN